MQSVGNVVKKSSSTLFWCLRSLPKPKREALYTLSAFCRHLDNIVHSDMPVKEKQELLSAWREELNNIYDKSIPATVIGRKIYKNCLRFNLPKEQWQSILNSAFLNVPKLLQAPERKVFEEYINGSAVTPLYLALMIIGGKVKAADFELAKNLGHATLITSILRDIKDDTKYNLFLFPRDILDQAGIKIEEVRQMVENKNISEARQLLAQEAKPAFAKAERLLNKTNKRETLALRYLLNINRYQYDIMDKRGWEIISPKPKISAFGRLHILYQTLFD